MNRESIGTKTWKTVVSLIFAILALIPIVWMIALSLKHQGTAFNGVSSYFIPPYTIENYIKLTLSSKIMLWMLNSVVVAVITTFFTITFTAMAAFALSRIRFRLNKFMYTLFIIGLLIPTEATIIPLYITINKFDMVDTFAGIILPCIASPLCIVILKNFFDSIPQDLIDSANLDGCGWFRSFWDIVLPLSKTAMSAISIFTFVGIWNNYLWPFLVLTTEEKFTLPVGIPVFNSSYSADYVLPMTANAIASIPIIIVFLIFEKQLVKGITMSGIKG